MERRLVVSDIHGENGLLLNALELAGYTPDRDRLFLLGDYMDRGHAAGATLKTVQSLVNDGAIALKGNHEYMMVEALTYSHD